MVCACDAPVHRRAFRRSHKRQRGGGGGGGGGRGGKGSGRDKTGSSGTMSEKASVVLVSLSLTLGARDKPLLMEEINFGLNRSPATL